MDAALPGTGSSSSARSSGSFTLESGDAQAKELLAAAPAVVAANDLLAMGVLAAAARRPLRPGRAQRDRIRRHRLCGVHLASATTVRQPAGAMGEEAVRLLLARLEGDEPRRAGRRRAGADEPEPPPARAGGR